MTSQLNQDNLPEHIAIIMDGNGRWAKAKNRPRLFGHNAGMKTLKKNSPGIIGCRNKNNHHVCIFHRELEAESRRS